MGFSVFSVLSLNFEKLSFLGLLKHYKIGGFSEILCFLLLKEKKIGSKMIIAKQERCKLLLLEPRKQRVSTRYEATVLSTPPWEKLVLKLSPLRGKAAQKLLLCSCESCFSKQSGAMEAQGSKLTRRQNAGMLEAESFSCCSQSGAACRCLWTSCFLELLKPPPLVCGQAASTALCSQGMA